MASRGGRTDVLRAALRSRALRRLLLAYLGFELVGMATWTLLMVVAYQHSGASAAGLIAVAQLVPGALIAPLATAWAERMRRRSALITSYAALAVAVAAIGVSLATSAPTWTFVVAAAASNCTATLCRPAHYAALPELASNAGELVVANSASSIMAGSGGFLGPMLLPLLYPFLSPNGIFFVLSAVAAVSMVAVASVRFTGQADAPAGDEPRAGTFVDEALAGVRELSATSGARPLLGLLGVVFMVVGALDVLSVVFPQLALGLGKNSASVLLAAPGFGALLGAALTVVLATRRRMTPALLLGFTSFGLCLAVAAGSQQLAMASILFALAGAARTFVDVAARTLLQRSIDARTLTRVFGLQESVYMGGLGLGALVAPILVHSLGARIPLVVVGLAPVVAVLVTWPLLRELDRHAVLPDPGRLALLRGVSIFHALPLPQMEHLARTALPQSVATDEVIVRQGDVGDHFYVVDSGSARVVRNGEQIAVHGPGAWFGEVALVHDQPRNASVIAGEPSELLSIDRETFLSVVARNRAAADEALRVAHQRRADAGEGDSPR
jgi:MFS family permease